MNIYVYINLNFAIILNAFNNFGEVQLKEVKFKITNSS